MLTKCQRPITSIISSTVAQPGLYAAIGCLSSWVLMSAEVSAQVVTDVQPDATLPTVSEVNGAGNITVTGGTADLSGNLFHSFRQFSIGETDRVFFDLGAQTNDIRTIITRVTGGAPSDLYGELSAGGTADFFLINPSGIIFGPEAALNIGGSFIGSTADSVLFSELAFSAVNPAVPNNLSLLTLSTPIGLQYGSNPANISVAGLGNDLLIDPVTFEIIRDFRSPGLEVDTGQTLALIGGDVNLMGGNLTAPQGRISLGALTNQGTVSLISTDPGWQFVYPVDVSLGDINFTAAASADVSGDGGGGLQLLGRQINFTEGSAVLSNTLDATDGGTVQIEATEAITAVGSSVDTFTQEALFPSGVFAEVAFDAAGAGGEIVITAPRLSLQDGGQLSTTTFGEGNAGPISIVADDIEITGQSPDEFFFSGIFAFTDLFALGDGGDVTLKTQTLLLDEGAEISTTTFGDGNAGSLGIQAQDIVLSGNSGLFASTEGGGNAGSLGIQAQDVILSGEAVIFAVVEFDATGEGGDLSLNISNLLVTEGSQISTATFGFGDAGILEVIAQAVELIGVSEFAPSGLFTDTGLDSTGQGGPLTLRTNQLRVLDGAQVATGTFGLGDAGDLKVFAETIELAGGSDFSRSGLLTTALVEDGDGGNLNIVTDELALRDGAIVSVSTFPTDEDLGLEPGRGSAGNLSILARTTLLDSQSVLSAETAAGERGNIDILTESLVLRRGSQITTNATETASGGNIRIDASRGFLVAVPTENSDITANATVGDGGRVDVVAQGIFGIEARPELTPLSDITASSEFGAVGEVVLTRLILEPTDDLENVPDLAAIPRLAQGCETAARGDGGRFIASGRGGVRTTPYGSLSSSEFLGDVQLPRGWGSASTRSDAESVEDEISTDEIIEAQGWHLSEDGAVTLTAVTPSESIGRCDRLSSDF